MSEYRVQSLVAVFGIGAVYACLWTMFYTGTMPLDLAEYENVVIWAVITTNTIQIPFFIFFVLFKRTPKVLVLVLSVLCTISFFIYFFVSFSDPLLHAVFLYISSIIFGLLRPLIVIAWFDFMYTFKYREVQTCSAAAICFASALVLLIMSLEQFISMAIVTLLPLLTGVAYAWGHKKRSARPTPLLEKPRTLFEKPKAVLSTIKKTPMSFLLVIFVVSVANGYIRGINVFGEPSGSILVFSAMCICCAVLPFVKTMKSVYYIAILSIAIGLNIMFISNYTISYSLIGFGQICISVIGWVACVAFAKKASVRPGIIGGFVWAVLTLGQVTGTVLGAVRDVQLLPELSFAVVIPLLIEICVLLVLVLTVNKPFLSLIHTEEQSMEKASDYANRIASVKGRYHLTSREAEVFEMLAYGRTARSIENKLNISMSTVKTHIRNIYIKMGINSHQELLSIIESE